MRERYWNFYTSIKYKSCYYMYYQIFAKRINIGLSQIIQAILPNLPYFDLLIPVKLMISAVDRQLLDIDHD